MKKNGKCFGLQGRNRKHKLWAFVSYKERNIKWILKEFWAAKTVVAVVCSWKWSWKFENGSLEVLKPNR